MKVLAKRGPILAIRKDRKQIIPTLYKKLTYNPYDTAKSKEEDGDMEENVVVKHYASNLANVIQSIIFLHARLWRMAHLGLDKLHTHQFAVMWQRVHANTKNKGEWIEGAMFGLGKKPIQKSWSLYECFQPLILVADEASRRTIQKRYEKWESSALKGTKKRELFNDYVQSLEKCTIDLETFCYQLFDADTKDNLVLDVMKGLDGHFHYLDARHIIAGVPELSRLGNSSYARQIIGGQQDDLLGLQSEDGAGDGGGGGGGGGGDGGGDGGDGGGRKKSNRKKKHILSFTAEEKALYKKVEKRAREMTRKAIDEDNQRDLDAPTTDFEEATIQKTAFLGLGLAEAEKLVRNVGRAACLRQAETIDSRYDTRVHRDPMEALARAEVANDEARLAGEGAAADMSMHILHYVYRCAIRMYQWGAFDGVTSGYESVAREESLPGGKEWKKQLKSLSPLPEVIQKTLREEVLQKAPMEQQGGGDGEEAETQEGGEAETQEGDEAETQEGDENRNPGGD